MFVLNLPFRTPRQTLCELLRKLQSCMKLKGETFKMKINFIFVIRLSRFFLIFNSWSCSIEHNNSCIVIVFIVLTSCRSISNLVPMQSLRSRWPAIGKQLNQEKPVLKSENIGLPFELRILVVKTDQSKSSP